MAKVLKYPNKSRPSPKKIPLSGKRFGMWQVLSESDKKGKNGSSYWNCICDCGKHKEVTGGDLRSGKSTNCGCRRTQHLVDSVKIHPTGSKVLYQVWHALLRRCYEKEHMSYHNYGGRGVTVCEEWRNDFRPFYDWAMANGWKPGLQVDKDIKGNGLLYSPDTCVIVTRKQNLQRKCDTFFVTHKDETKSLSEWCDIFSLAYSKTLYRIKKKGYSLQNCIEGKVLPPMDRHHRSTNVNLEYNGIIKTQTQWAAFLKTTSSEIYRGRKEGKSFSEIYERFASKMT